VPQRAWPGHSLSDSFTDARQNGAMKTRYRRLPLFVLLGGLLVFLLEGLGFGAGGKLLAMRFGGPQPWR
jgi:hypothetical protein